jgi:hypothetical protein
MIPVRPYLVLGVRLAASAWMRLLAGLSRYHDKLLRPILKVRPSEAKTADLETSCQTLKMALCRWLEPFLVVRVDFLEWTPEGSATRSSQDIQRP